MSSGWKIGAAAICLFVFAFICGLVYSYGYDAGEQEGRFAGSPKTVSDLEGAASYVLGISIEDARAMIADELAKTSLEMDDSFLVIDSDGRMVREEQMYADMVAEITRVIDEGYTVIDIHLDIGLDGPTGNMTMHYESPESAE